MAIVELTSPTPSTTSYTPDIEADYNSQNTLIARLIRRVSGVSLTNWDDSTSEPQIAAGSFVESLGKIFDITTNTAISTSGASTGLVYCVFDSSTPEFLWTNTAPTWSNTYSGYYTSTNKYTGHSLYWDGASSFSAKSLSPSYHGSLGFGFSPFSDAIFRRNATATGTTISKTAGQSTGDVLFPPGYILVTNITTTSDGAITLTSMGGVLYSTSLSITNGAPFSIISDGITSVYNVSGGSSGTAILQYYQYV